MPWTLRLLFLLVAGGLGGKRRADLGRFLGIHGGELCLHLGSLERGLRSSFIVLSIGAGSRSGLSDGSAAASPTPAVPSPAAAMAVAAFSAAALRALASAAARTFMAFSRAAFTSGVITLMGSAVETW